MQEKETLDKIQQFSIRTHITNKLGIGNFLNLMKSTYIKTAGSITFASKARMSTLTILIQQNLEVLVTTIRKTRYTN